jgi:hypothetical protein
VLGLPLSIFWLDDRLEVEHVASPHFSCDLLLSDKHPKTDRAVLVS